MPKAPKKPCAHPTCPELIEKGQSYCTQHRKEKYKQQDRDRKTAAQRGYNSRWQRYRKMFLRRNPLCVHCQEKERITPATEVDHIKPVSGADDPMFYEPGNHQALCKGCHSRKTMRESHKGHPTSKVYSRDP